MKDRLQHHHRDQLPPIVIGEQQDRVDFAAERFGAEGYQWPTPEQGGAPEGSEKLEAYRLKDNEDWIRKAIDDGRLVIDTGPVEPRVDYPDPTKGAHGEPRTPERYYRNEAHYEMERRVLSNAQYDRVMSPWEDMSRAPWRDAEGHLHMRNLDDAGRATLTELGVDPDVVTEKPWTFDTATYGRTSEQPPRLSESPARDER